MPANSRGISARIGVVLFVVGAVLLSGSAGAELSYDDYVAQVKAGKTDIDYAAFRMAYAATPKYSYATDWKVRELRAAMRKAYDAGDCLAALARAAEIFEINFVNIDAHLGAHLCHKKDGNTERERQEVMVFRGLVTSVLRSGDGRSPATAMVVITTDEEYAAMQALGVKMERQLLVREGASSFDLIEATKLSSGEKVTLYFNVDRPLNRSQPKQWEQ